jgi:hypothetical protein
MLGTIAEIHCNCKLQFVIPFYWWASETACERLSNDSRAFRYICNYNCNFCCNCNFVTRTRWPKCTAVIKVCKATDWSQVAEQLAKGTYPPTCQRSGRPTQTKNFHLIPFLHIIYFIKETKFCDFPLTCQKASPSFKKRFSPLLKKYFDCMFVKYLTHF